MQNTLFTTLTATEEANLSGGKKYKHKKEHEKEDPKKDPKALVKLDLKLNVVSIVQNNISIGDVDKLKQSNVAVVDL
ncbi:MAG: hypothetical protein KME55_03365 [Nostoc indistinguendum CM1-VF10]|jgi:hypothetical protein|nr:hypothetical protein [Nostoc indistinguendum CM1-VF10]MBW4451786.1 hypothetical protein [Nostoc indistinguendum CM1-VF10]